MADHYVGPAPAKYPSFLALDRADVLKDGDRILVDPAGDYTNAQPLFPCSVEVIGAGGLANPVRIWHRLDPAFNKEMQARIKTALGVTDAQVTAIVAEETAKLIANQPDRFVAGPRELAITRNGKSVTVQLKWNSNVSKGIFTAKIGVKWLKVSGFEFRNAIMGSTDNAAGIRTQSGTSLVAHNNRFINCQNGILTGAIALANPGAPWVNLRTGAKYALSGWNSIRRNEFVECGQGSEVHSIYLGPCALAEVAHNTLRNAQGGHHIKLNMGGGGVALVWENTGVDDVPTDPERRQTHAFIDMESGHLIAWNNGPAVKQPSTNSLSNWGQYFVIGNRRGWSPTGNTAIVLNNHLESRIAKVSAIIIARDFGDLRDHDSADLSNPVVAEFLARDPGSITGYIGGNVLLGGPNVTPVNVRVVQKDGKDLSTEIIVGPDNQFSPAPHVKLPIDGPANVQDFIPWLDGPFREAAPAAVEVDKIIAAIRFLDDHDEGVILEDEEDPMRIKELENEVAALKEDVARVTAERDYARAAGDEMSARLTASVNETAAERAKIADFNAALAALR